jgi:hypothetical protein
MSDVYYKIYQMNNGLLTIVCLQDFDECDYDQDRFFTDYWNNQFKFSREKAAEDWLNRNIKPQLIDPKHRKVKINKEDYWL